MLNGQKNLAGTMRIVEKDMKNRKCDVPGQDHIKNKEDKLRGFINFIIESKSFAFKEFPTKP